MVLPALDETSAGLLFLQILVGFLGFPQGFLKRVKSFFQGELFLTVLLFPLNQSLLELFYDILVMLSVFIDEVFFPSSQLLYFIS